MMYGFTFKPIAVIFTLLLSSTGFSAADKTSVYSFKLGCMACHQGESVPSDEEAKNEQDDLHLRNQEQA